MKLPAIGKGWIRLAIVVSVAWFSFWGWQLTTVLQRLKVINDYKHNPLFESTYVEVMAERDAIVTIALGVPIFASIALVATIWVIRGFREPHS